MSTWKQWYLFFSFFRVTMNTSMLELLDEFRTHKVLILLVWFEPVASCVRVKQLDQMSTKVGVQVKKQQQTQYSQISYSTVQFIPRGPRASIKEPILERAKTKLQCQICNQRMSDYW